VQVDANRFDIYPKTKAPKNLKPIVYKTSNPDQARDQFSRHFNRSKQMHQNMSIIQPTLTLDQFFRGNAVTETSGDINQATSRSKSRARNVQDDLQKISNDNSRKIQIFLNDQQNRVNFAAH
jgi:hypothetical protein